MPRGGGNAPSGLVPRAVKQRRKDLEEQAEKRKVTEEAEKEAARKSEEAAKEAARRYKQMRKAMMNIPSITLLARHGITGTPQEMRAAHRRFMLENHPDRSDTRGDTPAQKEEKQELFKQVHSAYLKVTEDSDDDEEGGRRRTRKRRHRKRKTHRRR
jgi:hypothetical protein